jgi:hypothetical protein
MSQSGRQDTLFGPGVAYGQAVNQALTPDNIAKVQTNVNTVMELFGGK